MDDSTSYSSDAEDLASIDFSLLSGANATFIAEMNRAWKDNPSSVDFHWARYFDHLGKVADFGADTEARPSWGRSRSQVVGAIETKGSIKAIAKAHGSGRQINAGDMRAATLDSLRAVMLI